MIFRSFRIMRWGVRVIKIKLFRVKTVMVRFVVSISGIVIGIWRLSWFWFSRDRLNRWQVIACKLGGGTLSWLGVAARKR